MVNIKITASDRNIDANIILFLKYIVFMTPLIVNTSIIITLNVYWLFSLGPMNKYLFYLLVIKFIFLMLIFSIPNGWQDQEKGMRGIVVVISEPQNLQFTNHGRIEMSKKKIVNLKILSSLFSCLFKFFCSRQKTTLEFLTARVMTVLLWLNLNIFFFWVHFYRSYNGIRIRNDVYAVLKATKNIMYTRFSW